MRILLAQINPIIGDLEGNTRKILNGIEEGRRQKAVIVLFPELALTGYPPEDFLLMPHFIKSVEEKIQEIQQTTSGITAIVGTPRVNQEKEGKRLYNSAAIMSDGKLLGYQDKTLLPTYDVFDERRYFEPSKKVQLWDIFGKKVGIIICEDIWQHAEVLKYGVYRHDPVLEMKKLHPDLVLNLSASPFSTSHLHDRMVVCAKSAITLQCPFLYCNQVGANDSLIFDGYSLCFNGLGQLIDYARGFQEDYLLFDSDKEYLPKEIIENPIEDLYQALVLGVRDYFNKLGFTKACLGISGGIDSALVACIAVAALGKENVLGVGMPSQFTSQMSLDDAQLLIHNLDIEYKEISIEEAYNTYLEILEPHFLGKPFDLTEENLQARIRGMILMALSNKFGYIVLNTGNKSELATGYCTLYGDMCGGLGVLNDVTKSQVYALSKFINRSHEIIPWNTINKAPTAELRYNQKDSDYLPEYAVVDNVLQAYLEKYLSIDDIVAKFDYPRDIVEDLIKRIHRNEYKRRQSPPGLRVSDKAFTVGRKFPIVQKWV